MLNWGIKEGFFSTDVNDIIKTAKNILSISVVVNHPFATQTMWFRWEVITRPRSCQQDTGTSLGLVPMRWSREFYRTKEKIISNWTAKLVESLLLAGAFTIPWAEPLWKWSRQKKAELKGDKFDIACGTGRQQCQIRSLVILVGYLKNKMNFQSERQTSVYLRSVRIGIWEPLFRAEAHK